MFSMTEFEIVTLIQEYGAAISDQYNFWMATTFAVVIASYTAGDRINRGFRIILVVLYLMACFVFFLRYLGAVDTVMLLAERLQSMGSDLGPRTVPVASYARRLLVISGTLVAVLIVLFPSWTGESRPPSPTDEET